MKLAKAIALIGLLAMSAVLIFAFTTGNFGTDGAKILANPWGIVSLVDLYVGFIIFSIWIVFREKSWLSALIWVVLMMVMGFWTGALYMLIALFKADSNWEKFWLGHRYKINRQ